MAPGTRVNGNLDEDFERDIQALIREQQQSRGIFDLDREELNIFRSGSAPPTVEGSRTALGNLFTSGGGFTNPPLLNGPSAGASLTEHDMTSHPAYLSYYYSNENLNPRMPPPAVSKEDWRARQRFHSGPALFGKIGDRRSKGYVDGDADSLFSLQPGEREMLQENMSQQRHSGEWLDTHGLIGLPDVGLGSRRKSFADALQEEVVRPTSATGNISHPASCNAYANVDPRVPGSQLLQSLNGSEALGDLQPGITTSGLVRVRSIGSSISHSFAPSMGSSLARGAIPDAHLIRRSPSPCLPPIGVRNSNSNNLTVVSSNGLEDASAQITDSSDILAAMSGLSLSKNMILDEEIGVKHRQSHGLSDQPDLLFNVPGDQRQFLQNKILNSPETEPLRTQSNHFMGFTDIANKSDGFADVSLSKSTSNGQSNLLNQSYANIYRKISSSSEETSQQHSADLAGITFSNLKHESYTGNQRQTMSNNQLDSDGIYNGNQLGYHLQLPVMESLYAQYLRGTSDSVLPGATSLDPSLGRNYFNGSHLDLPGYQDPYLGSLVANKLQYHMPSLNKSDGLNHRSYTNDAVGVGMSYPANQLSSTIHSPVGRGGPARQIERSSRVHSIMQSGRESIGTWSSKNGTVEEGYVSSLLEEFKNNKTRSFELSDIVGHVVEFSADQFGSRFIQQKLESASVEEKNKIFPEILLKARSLMTDVFGNYVIQKLFEHGTEEQRKQLANQLTGYVLQLSLQMYGCRVIQKALEVVDVDQKTQMVLELDGHVMKCVRDQNGNHVIQKCIECVPQENIQLIIEAFYGHVVALSTHPYGCRVIQRVLEHCDDPKTQNIMMDEIMQSVCTLAQDQYGNYVIQHVLQHGKPEERTAVIIKLCGQIVEMSQQKYASNVIEKCLTYGSAEERQLLINEMLGSTDENQPLQAMMKDQFANYVVQKVIEICDDRSRELILSRIKVHLSALKKYTYGKHIVARVEKLVAAGEKRISVSTCS